MMMYRSLVVGLLGAIAMLVANLHLDAQADPPAAPVPVLPADDGPPDATVASSRAHMARIRCR
jgi:hypothetical protein